MRRLRQLSIAVLLALMVSTPALAGIIGCPPEPAPAPEPPSASATETISTSPSGAQPTALASDPILDVALNLLQSVLAAL